MDNADIARQAQDFIRDARSKISEIEDEIPDDSKIHSLIGQLSDILDDIDDKCDDIEDSEECECDDIDCRCDELNIMQGIEDIEYYTPNMLDEQLMNALSEILKRSTVLAVTQLLESH